MLRILVCRLLQRRPVGRPEQRAPVDLLRRAHAIADECGGHQPADGIADDAGTDIAVADVLGGLGVVRDRRRCGLHVGLRTVREPRDGEPLSPRRYAPVVRCGWRGTVHPSGCMRCQIRATRRTTACATCRATASPATTPTARRARRAAPRRAALPVWASAAPFWPLGSLRQLRWCSATGRCK